MFLPEVNFFFLNVCGGAKMKVVMKDSNRKCLIIGRENISNQVVLKQIAMMNGSKDNGYQ